MKNSLYTSCDFCAEILAGKKGTAEIKKPYISVKGAVCLADYGHNGNPYYIYLADKESAFTQEMHFCNGQHLGDFLEARRILKKQERGAGFYDY